MRNHLYRIIVMLIALALVPSAPAQRLSALAPTPNWEELDRFQETLTREQFEGLLLGVYAPKGASLGLIEVRPDCAIVRKTLQPEQTWTLRFAKDPASVQPAPRSWKRAAERAPAETTQPLAGVKIALDPGHLGGPWARTEERWFQIGESLPVMEGDMTLRVAELLAPKLRELGAEVVFVRSVLGPTTSERPETLREAARAELALQGAVAPRETYASPEDPSRGSTVQFQSELLFYRISEIRHRAALVNTQLLPDLTLCLHFNAEAWGEPLKPDFVPRNHLHLLVNGCFSAVELRNDDIRFEMLAKLLSGCFPEELAASEYVAASLAKDTGLVPYEYPGTNAMRVGSGPYVWSRNLLANRLYRTPVLFLEPYVMNSQEVWERVQAGDYEGEKLVGGAMRKSIYREYADAVAEGLRNYYLATRPHR